MHLFDEANMQALSEDLAVNDSRPPIASAQRSTNSSPVTPARFAWLARRLQRDRLCSSGTEVMDVGKAHPTIKHTVQDYLNLPQSETERYELLEGEFVMVPAPSWFHQIISKRLFRPIDDFVRMHELGEVLYAPLDVELSQHVVVQPDLNFLSKDRLDLIQEGRLRGAPDLVIEILSESTAGRDRTTKRTLYARHGVREYWLVDPDAETVEVLTLGEAGFTGTRLYQRDETLTSPLLEGLAIELANVFGNPS